MQKAVENFTRIVGRAEVFWSVCFMPKKFLLTTIGATLLLWSQPSSPQTAGETATWLRDHLRIWRLSIPEHNYVLFVSVNPTGIVFDELRGNPKDNYAEITYARLTNISAHSVSGATDSEGNKRLPFWSIDFTGLAKHCRRLYSDTADDCKMQSTVSTLALEPETSKTDIDRLLKALKHIAVENGAQLAKEDLF